MNSTEQTETIETQFDINNFDLQEIMNRARAERSKTFYAFFKSLSLNRRQAQPMWEQAFKQLFARFSH